MFTGLGWWAAIATWDLWMNGVRPSTSGPETFVLGAKTEGLRCGSLAE